METLANAAFRNQIVTEALKTSEVKIPKNQIIPLKEDDELQKVIKILMTQVMKKKE